MVIKEELNKTYNASYFSDVMELRDEIASIVSGLHLSLAIIATRTKNCTARVARHNTLLLNTFGFIKNCGNDCF